MSVAFVFMCAQVTKSPCEQATSEFRGALMGQLLLGICNSSAHVRAYTYYPYDDIRQTNDDRLDKTIA